MSPPAKAERTRAAATDTALDLVSRDGLEAITVGAVAERVGMSKSGVYAHYGSREALQLAVLEQAGARADAVVFAGLDAVPAGLERLEAFFTRWLAWTREAGLPGGCPFAAATFELDDRDGPVRDVVEVAQQALLQVIAALVTDAVDGGELTGDTDADQVAWELSAIYLGHHVALRFNRDPRARERAMTAYRALIGRHLSGPGAADTGTGSGPCRTAAGPGRTAARSDVPLDGRPGGARPGSATGGTAQPS